MKGSGRGREETGNKLGKGGGREKRGGRGSRRRWKEERKQEQEEEEGRWEGGRKMRKREGTMEGRRAGGEGDERNRGKGKRTIKGQKNSLADRPRNGKRGREKIIGTEIETNKQK